MFVSITAALLAIAPRFPKADADTTPPVITAPVDQSFATTTFPAFPVLVPATAVDDVDPNPVVSYSPQSFPLGTTSVIWTATDASGNFATSTSNVTITDATPPAPVVQHITLTIRDNNITAFSGNVDLPDSSAADISVLPTNSTSTVNVSPRSVLGVLEALELTSTEFKITDLSYSQSFKSFLVNCIAVPANNPSSDCFDWTFAVNGAFPQMGMDQFKLNDGDVVYLFFGSQHKVVASKNSVITGESFNLTAQAYDLATGAYVPLTGVTVGVGTLNPDFSFTEMATSTVDSSGQASFVLNSAGTFSAGIKEDFYFPSISITVNNPPSGGLGSGGGGAISHGKFDLAKALAFLTGKQNPDGSLDSSIATDWTAIAFSSADPGEAKTKLKNYLLSSRPDLTSITDYERHAMALQAMGINPYNGTQTDCISPIVKSFDGKQIGDKDLDTDDIFAIFPLLNAGYSGTDSIIQKEILYIISTQKPDGSWDESPDVTAAAIQAVGRFFTTPGYNAAMGKAIGFLASTQKLDGGWGNVDSTSWVTTMLNAVREGDPAHFIPLVSPTGFFPEDALANAQLADGGVTSANRVWSTSYAVTAASGIDWLDLLTAFPKPTDPASQSSAPGGGGFSGGGTVLGTSTSTAAVLPNATSTAASLASSTAPSIIASTTLLSLNTVQPTTTLPVLPQPKPKPKAKKIQPTITVVAPQVLGQITVKPEPTSAQTIQPAQPEPPANSENWFMRAWHAIGSIFTHLF